MSTKKPYLIDHDLIQATYVIVVFGLCDSDNNLRRNLVGVNSTEKKRNFPTVRDGEAPNSMRRYH